MAEGKWATPPWPVWALVTVLVAGLPLLANRLGNKSGEPPKADSAQSQASPSLPKMTYGTWTLRKSVDAQGKNWNNSTLKFTAQEEMPDGLVLMGFFEWRLDNELIGVEEVSGRYVTADRQIFLESTRVEQYDTLDGRILAAGSYSAKISPDNRKLLEGTWGSSAGQLPGYSGQWEATR
jgi:hypothetical protein